MALPEQYVSPISDSDRRLILDKIENSAHLDSAEAAILMIIEVEDAFRNDTVHYAEDGTLLKSPREVIKKLTQDGVITFVTKEQLQN